MRKLVGIAAVLAFTVPAQAGIRNLEWGSSLEAVLSVPGVVRTPHNSELPRRGTLKAWTAPPSERHDGQVAYFFDNDRLSAVAVAAYDPAYLIDVRRTLFIKYGTPIQTLQVPENSCDTTITTWIDRSAGNIIELMMELCNKEAEGSVVYMPIDKGLIDEF